MRTLALWLALAVGGLAEADTLADHPVVLDASGALLSWAPQELAYDRVLHLGWSYLETKVPTQEGGLPAYFTHSIFDGATGLGGDYLHAPAGLAAMMIESATRWYAYSGDDQAVALVRRLADHQLQHGTTPASFDWGGVPWSTSEPGQLDYGGSSYSGSDGAGVLEPDKAGELGYGYLELYELTGDTTYRDAAVGIADTLARHTQPGDASRSPLPFRVVAETGEIRYEYTANLTGTLMLYDELARLGLASAAHRDARDLVWAWLLAYPMQNQLWSIVFEDIPTGTTPEADPTQYIALKLAQYLLERPEIDPDWRAHVAPILPWVEANFAIDTVDEKGVQHGANAISEQKIYMVKMGNHTARYASVSALWAERAGDDAAREKAFRSLNWASYMCSPEGLVITGPGPQGAGYWYQTGYGDYLRNFSSALGANPAWAPPGEAHILRSSSIVSHVDYSGPGVRYTTFLPDAIEVVRVPFQPEAVTAGGVALPPTTDLTVAGYTLEALGTGDFVVRAHHVRSGDVALMAPPRSSGGCSIGDDGTDGPNLASQSLWALCLGLAALRRARKRPRSRGHPRRAGPAAQSSSWSGPSFASR